MFERVSEWFNLVQVGRVRGIGAPVRGALAPRGGLGRIGCAHHPTRAALFPSPNYRSDAWVQSAEAWEHCFELYWVPLSLDALALPDPIPSHAL